VREFHEMKSKNKSKKARLRKGSLKEIIVLAKKKYSVPDSIIISTQTVRQRLKRGKNNAPRSHVKAVKAKSKTSKTGALTKELMNKAVRHIAE